MIEVAYNILKWATHWQRCIVKVVPNDYGERRWRWGRAQWMGELHHLLKLTYSSEFYFNLRPDAHFVNSIRSHWARGMSTHARTHPQGDDDNGERLPRWSPFSHGGSHLRPNYASFGVFKCIDQNAETSEKCLSSWKRRALRSCVFVYVLCMCVLHRSEWEWCRRAERLWDIGGCKKVQFWGFELLITATLTPTSSLTAIRNTTTIFFFFFFYTQKHTPAGLGM